MATTGRHPADAAHGELIRLKGHVSWLIEQVEALFPHLAKAAPEVAQTAEDAAQVVQDVNEVAHPAP